MALIYLFLKSRLSKTLLTRMIQILFPKQLYLSTSNQGRWRPLTTIPGDAVLFLPPQRVFLPLADVGFTVWGLSSAKYS